MTRTLLNLELREECSRTLGPGMGWNPVCNRGAAVEADAIGRAAVEADAIGEQQLQSGSSSRSRRDREQQLIMKAASSS